MIRASTRSTRGRSNATYSVSSAEPGGDPLFAANPLLERLTIVSRTNVVDGIHPPCPPFARGGAGTKDSPPCKGGVEGGDQGITSA